MNNSCGNNESEATLKTLTSDEKSVSDLRHYRHRRRHHRCCCRRHRGRHNVIFWDINGGRLRLKKMIAIDSTIAKKNNLV